MARKKTEGKSSDLDLLGKISAGVKADIIKVEDIEEVKFVPSVFTSYNRAGGIGGHALGRITMVHGPNQVGKSVLALGLAESLRRQGHISMVFDTEFAAEKSWYNAITPKSGFSQPRNLDELFDTIRTMLANLKAAHNARKKEDRISKDIGCCFVIDTMTKLLPKKILEQIEAEGIDKMYPIQALHISVWAKEIIPILAETNSSVIVVLQERTAVGATAFQKQYKVTLGNALQYDNCMRIRVTHLKKVEQSKKVVGMQSFFKVENNKIDGTSFDDGSFFTSNGKGILPKGLDLIREAMEEGKRREVVNRSGGEVKINIGEYAQKIEGGWIDVVEHFADNPEDFDKYVGALNAQTLRI
jgi:RecA/RadA recombinase